MRSLRAGRRPWLHIGYPATARRFTSDTPYGAVLQDSPDQEFNLFLLRRCRSQPLCVPPPSSPFIKEMAMNCVAGMRFELTLPYPEPTGGFPHVAVPSQTLKNYFAPLASTKLAVGMCPLSTCPQTRWTETVRHSRLGSSLRAVPVRVSLHSAPGCSQQAQVS